MQRRIAVAVLLVSVALAVSACGGSAAVNGTVAINGERPGDVEVKITALNTEQQTVANKSGNFQLELEPGPYTLEARVNGLEPIRAEINVVDGQQLSVDMDIPYELTTPYNPDFSDPMQLFAVERTWPLLNYRLKRDRFGDMALFFPPGADDQAPPEGYQAMRFALLNLPPMDTFALSLEQIGEGGERPPQANPNVSGGNRSLSIVFGYQDYNNWWVIYYTYTNTTSVRRMANGQQQYICRPMDLEQWMPSNDQYQLAEVRLERDGDDMVVRAYANGEPISIDGCRFPAEDYTPGKIGVGGHSTSDLQSWYFKNIQVNSL